MLEMVEVAEHPPERFESVLEPEPFEKLAAGIHRARELLGEHTVWNVSSTAKGGGVVELLLPLIGYAKGAGVDARWAVIQGNPDFFKVTKRIHNNLHGYAGDGGALDDEARKTYEDALEPNAAELVELVDADDIVVLHDPQTVGLIGPLKRTGAKVVWRCHIGVDEPDDLARRAWDFLRVDVEQADAYVFSREAFVWEGLDDDKVAIIAPSIDAFNAKNQELDSDQVAAILAAAGIVDGGDGEPTFKRGDGSEAPRRQPGRAVRGLARDARRRDRPAGLALGPPEGPEGVIRGFAEHVLPRDRRPPDLRRAGRRGRLRRPRGRRGARGGEGGARRARRGRPPQHPPRLPAARRRRGERGDRQRAPARRRRRRAEEHRRGLRPDRRRGDVEGPAGGRHRGRRHPGPGIDGETGLLLADPEDLDAYGAAVRSLLEDPERAKRMGEAAKARVRDEFLGARSLLDYLSLIGKLLA